MNNCSVCGKKFTCGCQKTHDENGNVTKELKQPLPNMNENKKLQKAIKFNELGMVRYFVEEKGLKISDDATQEEKEIFEDFADKLSIKGDVDHWVDIHVNFGNNIVRSRTGVPKNDGLKMYKVMARHVSYTIPMNVIQHEYLFQQFLTTDTIPPSYNIVNVDAMPEMYNHAV